MVDAFIFLYPQLSEQFIYDSMSSPQSFTPSALLDYWQFIKAQNTLISLDKHT
jgi:hypothetical protein